MKLLIKEFFCKYNHITVFFTENFIHKASTSPFNPSNLTVLIYSTFSWIKTARLNRLNRPIGLFYHCFNKNQILHLKKKLASF